MLFVITDANIRGGKPWLCQKFSENAGILQPETLLSDFEVPQVRDLDVWRTLPGLRPGPFMSLASTAPPLLSTNSAAATWPLSAAQCSGVEPQALVPGNPSATVGFGGTMARRPMCRGWRTEMWAAEFYIRSTDKGTMNVLDSTASNCAKQNIFTHNHKHIEQVSWHFDAFCFQQITFNETLSIINSLIVCFQKLKRLLKTRSSSKSNSW